MAANPAFIQLIIFLLENYFVPLLSKGLIKVALLVLLNVSSVTLHIETLK